MKRIIVAAATLGASALLICGGFDAAVAHDLPVTADDPFWVNPDSRAARQALAWEDRGRADMAALMWRIAGEPMATWITDTDPQEQVRTITEAAAQENRIPVLVAYNIPHRDCGLYSSGGAADAAAYRAWIGQLAAGIEGRRATVVLEPDAVAHLVSGCVGAAPAEVSGEGRLPLLAEAVRTLKARPGTSVYLDAGNAAWIPDPLSVAGALTQAGVKQADGFALNVSNFQTTPVSEAYGDKLSKLLGGMHYVVDTSRNGNGPWTGAQFGETWCNPPGRALGQSPTTRTDNPLVDAYLWVKRPGESDGSCRGAPPAGSWWTDYALALAGAALTGVDVVTGRESTSPGTAFPASP
jgi:endoglucanase